MPERQGKNVGKGSSTHLRKCRGRGATQEKNEERRKKGKKLERGKKKEEKAEIVKGTRTKKDSELETNRTGLTDGKQEEGDGRSEGWFFHLRVGANGHITKDRNEGGDLG